MQSLIKGKASYVIAWFLLFYWILAAFVVSERFLTNKPSTSQPDENASAADLTQLRTMVEQLSERINKLNNGTAVGSARNDAGLEGLQKDLSKLTSYVKNINLTVPAPIITVKETVSRAVEENPVHIKNTHPALMKYRYAEADAETNSGKPFEAVLKPDLVLLEENGMKFWGWNFSFMVEYVFDKAGGEQLVRDVFKVVLGRLKTPKLVLDVGSNVGYFSLIAALYNTKRIYSFDPQRLCTKRLSESAKFNGFDSRIAAINAYVSKDEKGVAFFPTDTCGGSFSVTDDNAGKNADVTHAEVHSVNLDTIFLADPDYIDLMKVDVEGAELMVLEGAQELLKKHRIRNLVIEITTGWWNSSFGIQYETGAKLIKEALVDSGYKVWLMPISVSATFIKVEGWDELDKILRPPPGYHNQKNFLFTLDEF